MPNQPKTPMKSFRIPQDRYDRAMAKAQAQERSLTEVVNEKLEEYLSED